MTEKSPEQRWALGWHQGEDTVVLWTAAGTMVYNVRPKGTIEAMECPPPAYGETGLCLMRAKYRQIEQNETEGDGGP